MAETPQINPEASIRDIAQPVGQRTKPTKAAQEALQARAQAMGVPQIEGFKDTGQAGRAFVYNSAGQRVDSLGPSGSDSTRKETNVQFTGRKDSKGRLEVKYDVTDNKGRVTHRQGFVNANYVGAIRPDQKVELSPAAQNILRDAPGTPAADRITTAHQASPAVPTADASTLTDRYAKVAGEEIKRDGLSIKGMHWTYQGLGNSLEINDGGAVVSNGQGGYWEPPAGATASLVRGGHLSWHDASGASITPQFTK